MGRRVFYSFHFKKDVWRVSQIRNIGTIEDNKPALDNDWEEIKKGGDSAIRKWIDNQMQGRSCIIVMVGEQTAGRKWIDYEIEKAWNDKKGLLGIRIHKLEDVKGDQSEAGNNPFDTFTLDNGKKKLSAVVKLKNPPQESGKGVYAYIKDNLSDWIEEAIEIRNSY